MKYLWSITLIIALVGTCTNTYARSAAEIAESGFGPGNGGSGIGIEWTDLTKKVLGIVKNFPGHFQEVDFDDLKRMINDAKVVALKTLKTKKDPRVLVALNFPKKKQILVAADGWDQLNSEPTKLVMILHEYLGLLELEKNNYSISNRIIRDGLFKKQNHSQSFRDSVFSEFGPLKVKAAPATEIYRQKITPWSAYWYPMTELDQLIGTPQTKDTPIQKLDSILTENQMEATASENENYFLKQWGRFSYYEEYGYAMTLAGCIFPEPNKEITIGKTSLSISDQKAILIKMAEATNFTTYGSGFSRSSKGMQPDIFHKLVTHHIKLGLPLILDYDGGRDEWLKPIYEYRFSSKKVNNTTIEYTARIGAVMHKPAISPIEVTTKYDLTGFIYKYELDIEPTADSSGRHKVTGGRWIGNSLRSRPDFLIVPKSAPLSNNPVLNRYSKWILEKLVD